jgi:phosphoribosylamine--glycine ligase
VQLFHAGTRSDDTGQLHTAGGRVLAMVAQAGDFDTAFERAYDALRAVRLEGMTYRRDIGHQVRSR